jgi:hypothetical protein
VSRLTEFQKRYFQRLEGSNTILSSNSSSPEIRKVFKEAGITNEAIRITYFDSSISADVLNLELTTPQSKTIKKLTFKD